MTAHDDIRACLARVVAVVGDMNLETLAWDAELDRFSAAVDAAYAAHDLAALRAALDSHEAFAREQRATWDRQCRACGRGPSPHRNPLVCRAYEPRVDVLEGVAA